jgi:glycosyltransferase involved in cell wall biosynthesis
MLTVAYLANEFPAAGEPYVGDEIAELRRRGIRVFAGSVRKPDAAQRESAKTAGDSEILCLQPIRLLTLLRAIGLAIRHWNRISGLVSQALLRGRESPGRRLKALLHTWLGAYYAVQLRGREIDHIHVHHGYFGAWIAMVAARLLGVSYSLTLHGSDLLVNGAYLDAKLKNCRFCLTVSEFNRRYILQHFPAIDPGRVVVSRLGVNVPEQAGFPGDITPERHRFTLLAVGRLHAVKDHAFLIKACARLRDRGIDLECAIAGEGPERPRLAALILRNSLQEHCKLLGHVPPERMDALYRAADVVVLTSRSEGIPLVLMEAMARRKLVVAPAITGIPEIVVPGKTGFLYAPGRSDDLVAKILFLQERMHAEDRPAVSRLHWMRHAARVQVIHNFNRSKNLTRFGDRFLHRVAAGNFANENWSPSYEDSVLQQI